MNLSTRDMIMKKILDAQDSVRDYEMFAKQVGDQEIATIFNSFAEETGSQAAKLRQMIGKIENSSK